MSYDLKEILSSMLAICIFFVYPVAAWITHVFCTIQQEAWGLLVAGTILFPIGIIHGTMIWFGGA